MQGKNVRVRSSEGASSIATGHASRAQRFWRSCLLRRARASTRIFARSRMSSPAGTSRGARSVSGARSPGRWRATTWHQRLAACLEKSRTGRADLADTLAELRKLPQSNGRAAVSLCYGGLATRTKRLGYDAGISCHGSR